MKTNKEIEKPAIAGPKKIFNNIIGNINAIFNDKHTYSSEEFQKLLNKIMVGEHRAIQQDPESQKKCFETICYIINNLCNDTKIKKFYNTAPNTSLTKYQKDTISSQLLNNIYHSNRQRFYHNAIGGGNCHYRSVLFKKILDIFKEQGLQIESKIIAYKNTGGHSFVMSTFQGKQYIFDVGGFDVISNSNVTAVETLPTEIQTALKHQMKNATKKDSKIIIYHDTKEFAQYIDEKPIQNISIQFKPKLENHISNQIDIAINKKHISIHIDEEKYIIHIPKNYKPQDYITNSTQFFNDLINSSNADPETKTVYSKYIYMIADKINYHKIKQLWDQ